MRQEQRLRAYVQEHDQLAMRMWNQAGRAKVTENAKCNVKFFKNRLLSNPERRWLIGNR